ncbi:MAG: hypothetical protein PHW73_00005 [Atribacterota bacterium]|nr:hypothetical protein [Atribacterota bacterium]
MNKKDQNLIKKAAEKKIPIFVISADDECALPAIQKYLNECILSPCSPEHNIGVMERLNEFIQWQNNNPDQVNLPD